MKKPKHRTEDEGGKLLALAAIYGLNLFILMIANRLRGDTMFPRLIISFIIVSVAMSLTLHRVSAAEPVPVSDVNFARYAGTWYELSNTHFIYDIGCTCTTARYEVLSESTISVYNACYRFFPRGPLSTISGVGEVPNLSEPGKLLVSFEGFPAEADYWIIDLVEDPWNPEGPYNFAAISEPAGEFIYILHRKPTLETQVDFEAFNALLDRLAAQGLPVDELRLTPQLRTCDYDGQLLGR